MANTTPLLGLLPASICKLVKQINVFYPLITFFKFALARALPILLGAMFEFKYKTFLTFHILWTRNLPSSSQRNHVPGSTTLDSGS